MAKISGIKKILKDQIPDAPGWFDKVLNPLNGFMDTVVSALRGKLTYQDNFLSETRTLNMVHDVEQQFSTNLLSFNGLHIVKTPNNNDDDYMITAWRSRRTDNGNIALKVHFNGAGTTEGNVTFIVF